MPKLVVLFFEAALQIPQKKQKLEKSTSFCACFG